MPVYNVLALAARSMVGRARRVVGLAPHELQLVLQLSRQLLFQLEIWTFTHYFYLVSLFTGIIDNMNGSALCLGRVLFLLEDSLLCTRKRKSVPKSIISNLFLFSELKGRSFWWVKTPWVSGMSRKTRFGRIFLKINLAPRILRAKKGQNGLYLDCSTAQP